MVEECVVAYVLLTTAALIKSVYGKFSPGWAFAGMPVYNVILVPAYIGYLGYEKFKSRG